MATTIKQMAQKLNTTPRKLLSEFIRKFPEQTWTVDSELPEGFEDAASNHAQEYAEASGMDLPKGAITSMPEALKDNKVILESIEYGIIEAISQMRSQSLIQSAKLQAIRDIQETESAYNSVWEAYFETKSAAARKQSETTNLQTTEASINLSNELGKRQGAMIRIQASLNDYQQQNTTDIDNAINALLK